MMRRILPIVAALVAAWSPALSQTAPLRIFLRGGPKTHGEGEHDHPRFVDDWKKLLSERGAVVDGGLTFPTAEQLARTDVLVMYAAEGGSIHGAERDNLDAYLKRGGGIVALHDSVCGDDSQWFKTVIGGAWEHGHAKYHTDTIDLYVTGEKSPITDGAENFRFDDEIYYELHMQPEAKVLMTGFHSVFDITPQMWTYEKDDYRAFVSIQGHYTKSFEHPAWRTLLLRGIAWAGKRDVGLLLKKGEAEALAYPLGGPTKPEEASKLIDLHPDFDLSLAAAEPLVVKPISIDWDARGRMWVAMTPGYPEKERFSKIPAHDEIAILSDKNGDGRMDERKTFFQGLDLVTTFVFHSDGVIVGQSPDILVLCDTDHDDVCDKREVVFTGFGFGDTHAVMSSFHWGPDGWIYATQGYSGNDSRHITNAAGHDFGKIGNGLFRFKPDGSAIEMVSSYGSNTWGCDFSSTGELFFTMANGAHLRHVVMPERFLEGNRIDNVESWADCPDHDRVFPAIVHNDAPYAQIDFVGGFTAASGCTLYKGGAWPSEWNDAHFVCEPTVHIVHHDVIEPKGVTFTAHKAREAEFIAGRDLWFRPIDTRVGPDGALYVLDFYNQAVVHNDTRGPKHGPTNFAIRPDRDHEHGRIWRVQHKQATRPVARERATLPIFADRKSAATDVELLQQARSTNPRDALLAWTALGDRPLSPAITTLACDQWNGERDAWTRSQVVRCLSRDLSASFAQMRKEKRADSFAPFAAELTRCTVRRDGRKGAERATALVARGDRTDEKFRLAVLDTIARDTRWDSPVGSQEMMRDAVELALGDPSERVAAAALPLVGRWSLDTELAASVSRLAERLQARLRDPNADLAARIDALRALVSSTAQRAESISAAGPLLTSTVPPEQQLATLDALSRTDDGAAAKVIADSYSGLANTSRERAFELLVARASWAGALLDRIEAKGIATADLGPQKIHRLRNHPDAATSQRASKLFETLAGASNAKVNELIAKLLPEVDKPGDRAHGKEVFKQNCATCHTAFGEGAKVGPDISGMGTHGARDLLPIVLDPNRAVEAAYAEWTVTTKDERSFSGVLARETNDSVLLRSSSGDVEVAREDIDAMKNTGRSPMPAGFESLGADALRDVFAYLAGDFVGFRVLDIKKVVTSSTLRGMYDEKRDGNPMLFKSYGVQAVEGVPFDVLDPRRTDSGCNVITLKGGMVADWESKTRKPQRVEIPVGCAVERVHVLGGIGGWAFPYIKTVKPVVKWTWKFADGSTEELQLSNGVEFADWISHNDVPGSKYVEGALADDSWGQVRYFAVEPKAKKVVDAIVLESFDNDIAPTLVALTAELPGAVRPASAVKEEKPVQALDVLILGGGSSHDFDKYYDKADRATLGAANIASVRYTTSFDDAARQLDQLKALVLCTNQPSPSPAFRTGLFDFVAKGGGLLVYHPGNWFNWNDWPEYNAQLVHGGAHGHEKFQEFDVRIVDPSHEVTRGVPLSFSIADELYQYERDAGAGEIHPLAIGFSRETGKSYPVAWTVDRPKGRTVCLTLGHDDKAHSNPAFQMLYSNCVRWISQR